MTSELQIEGLKIQALNLQAPEPFEELEEAALELWRQDQISALELGRALIRVREACISQGHGRWYKWFRLHGLDENRVHYCIRLAERKALDFRCTGPNLPALKKELHRTILELPEQIVEAGTEKAGRKFADALFQMLTCAFCEGNVHWNTAGPDFYRAANEFVAAFERVVSVAVFTEEPRC